MAASSLIDAARAVEPPQPLVGTALLAVCALCGGAGASTLAYLTARAATARSDQPVLLCDAGGPTGGLALYAGTQAPRSVAAAANALADREPPSAGLFVDADEGLRVLAGAPDLDQEADPQGLSRLLRDARLAHGLTVVDCGTLQRRAQLQVLAAASHVAWVVPATVSGVRRGRRVLELFSRDPARQELVVARHDAAGRTPPAEELSGLAALRDAPLVLMPAVADLGEAPPKQALRAVDLTMEAIWTVLRR